MSDVVSVVIPVCNAEPYLEDTLKSAFGQTYSHIQIIVVDDGSRDRSVDILERYSGRLVLIKQQNSSAAAARNRGVRVARGKWIAFLDADDLWSPDKIQRQLDASGHCVWSYTDTMFMGGVNDGKKDSDLNKKHQGRVLENLVCNNFISTSSVLIHMKVIERAFAEDGPAGSLRHLMPSVKARSYSICSQIAEEEGDRSFALRCSVLACRQEPLGIRLWERAFKSFVKYLAHLIGRPVAQHARWLVMIVAFGPVVPV